MLSLVQDAMTIQSVLNYHDAISPRTDPGKTDWHESLKYFHDLGYHRLFRQPVTLQLDQEDKGICI